MKRKDTILCIFDLLCVSRVLEMVVLVSNIGTICTNVFNICAIRIKVIFFNGAICNGIGTNGTCTKITNQYYLENPNSCYIFVYHQENMSV